MKERGYFLTILSAIIFGFTPILAKFTYNMGNNGITLAFFRHLFVIPILFIMIKLLKINYKISLQQLKKIILVGVIGNAFTVAMLYTSYSYIQVGSATVLHFLYPMFVSLICFFYYKEQLSKTVRICLVIASIGILFFIEGGNTSFIGLFLALFSGITFAYYIVGVEKLGLQMINPYVLNFYFAIVIAITLLIIGIVSNQLVLNLPMTAYGYSFIIAILTSIIGIICLQQGIKYLGATTASILSMFEPVTSVIFGIIILHERLTIVKAIGCLIILGAVIGLIVSNSKKEE
ncbi:MAG: EamA family transporter [[Clostridium] spiroforme]|uniref:EamA family transporter n=1 Tax=Thomasclavelia spiroformis TaxID=29348 RepID=A0A943ELJ1_9FIRM|nr:MULTISPECIES: DMT family transporter [Thomasclavelia]MBS5588912.1 EamA family transporter [Thomasclavelia spiroformis]